MKNEFRKTMNKLCSKQNVDKWIAVFYLFGDLLLLGHAAAQNDYATVTSLMLFEGTYVTKNAVFGVFPYCAGVKEDQIGLVNIFGKVEAHIPKHSLHSLGIADILLTAVGVNVGKRLFIIPCGDKLCRLLRKVPLTRKFDR